MSHMCSSVRSASLIHMDVKSDNCLMQFKQHTNNPVGKQINNLNNDNLIIMTYLKNKTLKCLIKACAFVCAFLKSNCDYN